MRLLLFVCLLSSVLLFPRRSAASNDEALLRQFVLFASRNGFPARWYYINISHDLIVNQLKALIARDALGYDAFYRIANTMDPDVKRAVEELLNGSAAFPILPEKGPVPVNN